jgi:phytanoyl-CoA hydroxylase
MKYGATTPEINAQQFKAAFDRDGYVVIRQFLDPNELSELRRELDRYIGRIAELPRTDVMFEDRGRPDTLKQLAHMKQNDAFFAEFIVRPRWIGLSAVLLDDTAVAKELEWFNKPPRASRETPAHQDGYYFMLTPAESTTMWLALDSVDEWNGCVRYVPGSQRRGLRPHARTDVLGFSQGITDYGEADYAAEVPIRAEPGDLLVHHALTVHRADANNSDRHRRSLGLIYYAAGAQQDKVRLAAYQQNLNAELLEGQKL